MKKIGIVGLITGVMMVLFVGFTNLKTEPSIFKINLFLAGEILTLAGSIVLVICLWAEREERKEFKKFLKDFFF